MIKSLFPSLTLMLMISMVYSNSTRLYLEQVKEEAERASKLKLDEQVLDVSDQDNPCKKEFFCLAEQAIRNVHNVTRLNRTLAVYNNRTNNTICAPINLTTFFRLSELVKEILKCANTYLNPPQNN